MDLRVLQVSFWLFRLRRKWYKIYQKIIMKIHSRPKVRKDQLNILLFKYSLFVWGSESFNHACSNGASYTDQPKKTSLPRNAKLRREKWIRVFYPRDVAEKPRDISRRNSARFRAETRRNISTSVETCNSFDILPSIDSLREILNSHFP